MKLYKTATRSINIKDDELIFTTWIGLWSIFGLLCAIIGGVIIKINTIYGKPLSFWYVFFILLLILGINLLFGRKNVVINNNTHLVTRTIKTLLFKLTKHVNINEFNQIQVELDLVDKRVAFDMPNLGKQNNAVKVFLVKVIPGTSYISNSFELADFYEPNGYALFTKALAKHIGWDCPATLKHGRTEIPLDIK